MDETTFDAEVAKLFNEEFATQLRKVLKEGDEDKSLSVSIEVSILNYDFWKERKKRKGNLLFLMVWKFNVEDSIFRFVSFYKLYVVFRHLRILVSNFINFLIDIF